MTKLYKKQQFL